MLNKVPFLIEGREGQKRGINGMLLTKCEVHFFTMLSTISQPSVQDWRSIKCDCVRVQVCVFVCMRVSVWILYVFCSTPRWGRQTETEGAVGLLLEGQQWAMRPHLCRGGPGWRRWPSLSKAGWHQTGHLHLPPPSLSVSAPPLPHSPPPDRKETASGAAYIFFTFYGASKHQHYSTVGSVQLNSHMIPCIWIGETSPYFMLNRWQLPGKVLETYLNLPSDYYNNYLLYPNMIYQ